MLYAAVADIPGNSFVGPEYLLHMRGPPELIKSSKVAQDADLAQRLWIVSEELTGVQFALQPNRGRGKKVSSQHPARDSDLQRQIGAGLNAADVTGSATTRDSLARLLARGRRI